MDCWTDLLGTDLWDRISVWSDMLESQMDNYKDMQNDHKET